MPSRFSALFSTSWFSSLPLTLCLPLTLWRAVMFALTVSLSALVITPASAANGNDLPTRNEVQNQLDALSKQKSLTPVDKLSQQDLIHTLEYLDALDRVKQDAAQLRQQVTEAPAKLRVATDGLARLKNGDNDGVTQASLAALPLRQLENRLNDTLDDLQSSQDDLSTFNTQWTKNRDKTGAGMLEYSTARLAAPL